MLLLLYLMRKNIQKTNQVFKRLHHCFKIVAELIQCPPTYTNIQFHLLKYQLKLIS